MIVNLSMWILAATLSQAPAESAWLKAVPADVDVAVRVHPVDATRNDLMAMLKAMSPTLAARVEPQLSGMLAGMRATYGEAVFKAPWVGMARFAGAKPGGGQPYALLVMLDDYEGVLKKVAGRDEVKREPQDGGYDAFDGPAGAGRFYAAKGAGFVAFGPDETLIAEIAKPGEKTLGMVLTPALAKPFLAGEAGVYVNIHALATHFADRIDQARQALMTTLDQAGEKLGNASTMETAKKLYGGLFDSLKYAEALTFSLDFADTGLHLAGELSVKPDSEVAKSIVASKTSTAADLARFGQDSAFYMYFNMQASTIERLQSLSVSMLSGGGKPLPDLEKAIAQLHALGQVETYGAGSFVNGMRSMNVVTVSDPQRYLSAGKAMLVAMKGAEGDLNIYKDVKIDPAVETYQGFTFDHVAMTIDMAKLEKLAANNPGGAANMKSMFGGDHLNNWLGTDGKQVVQITAPTWDEAKAQVDSYMKESAGIGSVPSYKAVRSRLPEQVSLLAIANAQGFLGMFARQFAATLNRPDLKVPADLPKEPALFGGSLTPTPSLPGIEFHFELPSQVGPVIEKGFVPLFQNLQAQPPRIRTPEAAPPKEL